MSQAEHSTFTTKRHVVHSTDGTAIKVWQVVPEIAQNPIIKRPAVILVHGGGFVTGGLKRPFNAASFRPEQLPWNWLQNDIVCLYVEYRLAYNIKNLFNGVANPFPKPFEDVYSTLVWANQNADMLGINPANISIVGFSAGGCLALATAVKAKKEELDPPLAKLILIYPMLDPDTTWENEDGRSDSWKERFHKRVMKFCWHKYLKGYETSKQKESARPLHMNLIGLPRTYLDVGTKDYFHVEGKTLVELLKRANVECEYNWWEGMRHAFEQEKKQSTDHAKIVQEAQAKRLAFIMGVESRV